MAGVSRKTLREQVAEVLRNKILSGEMKPGEKIVEQDVAEKLDTSRGPVREAFRQIEEEGLVTYESYKGCIVKAMTYEEMQESYLIRSTLEMLAVRMCSAVLPPQLDESMQEILKKLGEASENKDLYKIIELDEQFHACIIRAAQSEKLWKVWSSLSSGNRAAYYTMNTESLVPFDVIKENHELIRKAFQEKNIEKTCATIEEHYMIVPEVLFQRLQKKKAVSTSE